MTRRGNRLTEFALVEKRSNLRLRVRPLLTNGMPPNNTAPPAQPTTNVSESFLSTNSNTLDSSSTTPRTMPNHFALNDPALPFFGFVFNKRHNNNAPKPNNEAATTTIPTAEKPI